MRLLEITTDVRDLAEAARFYGDVLGLPTRPSSQGLEVTVGASTLALREAPGSDVCDHVAVDIPSGRLAEATAWLRSRGVEPLTKDGVVEIDAPPSWNARSVYFTGPSRSILEFIERRDLQESGPAGFDSASILRVSEVGIATDDVPGDRELLARVGIDVYGAAASDVFSPVGDIHGLLLLVEPGRPWLPTDDHLATASPLEVRVEAARPVDLHIGSARIRSGDG